MTLATPYGPPATPWVQTQVVWAPPHRCSTAHVVVAWVCALLTGFYLLPWAVAATRGRRNTAAVALVDLLLGWTVVGWFVALVMACGSDRPVVVVQHTYAPGTPSWAPAVPPSTPQAPARAPLARATGYEPTVVDPFGGEPTVLLPSGPGPRDQR